MSDILNNKELIYNLVLFLKNNIKIILLSTLIIAGTIIFFFSLNRNNANEQFISNDDIVINEEYVIKEILPVINNESDINQLTNVEQEALDTYLNTDTYHFSFIVENQNESLFQDDQIIKQLLSSKEHNDYVSEEIVESREFLPGLMLNVERREGSSIFDLSIATGNRTLNRRISKYYIEVLDQNEINFLNNKNIHLLDTRPVFVDSTKTFETLRIVNSPEENLAKSRDSRNIIITTVAGILAGLVIGFIISFTKELFNKRISYIYNYNLKGNKNLINLDLIPEVANLDLIEAVKSNLLKSSNTRFLLITQSYLGSSLKSEINEINLDAEVRFTQNIRNIKQSEVEEVDEIVILIELGKTPKKWYEDQMKFLDKYDIDIKIIRLPNIE